MSIGNKVIDKMISKIMDFAAINSGCYDPNPFLEAIREKYKQQRIDSGTQMPDDIGEFENRLIKLMKNTVETGYPEIDKIVKQLDENEIEIGTINEYGSNFSIHFIAKNPSVQMGYRELANKNSNENDPNRALITINRQIEVDVKNKIEKYTRMSNREVKFLVGFCDKLHNKTLPKIAKSGSGYFDYSLPLWFLIIYNWRIILETFVYTKHKFSKNKLDIYHDFIKNQMLSMGYKFVFNFHNNYIRIQWQ